jgi:alkylated DNA repair dioxygenase AlkB
MTARQPSLFETGASGLRPLELAERRPLGDGAWVELRPDWVVEHAVLFDRLLEEVPWRSEQRVMYGKLVEVPRLAGFFDEGSTLPDPLLEQARAALSRRYCPSDPLRTVGCCLYRSGRDSVAWHGDRIGRGDREDTVVAILSLGGTRRLLLRPRVGGAGLRFTLHGGDLLVMGGSCQRTWEHSVPKTSRHAEPRISVQFRPTGVR